MREDKPDLDRSAAYLEEMGMTKAAEEIRRASLMLEVKEKAAADREAFLDKGLIDILLAWHGWSREDIEPSLNTGSGRRQLARQVLSEFLKEAQGSPQFPVEISDDVAMRAADAFRRLSCYSTATIPEAMRVAVNVALSGGRAEEAP